MFVQVKYQLRSRGRSVLVLCIAALLAACMAFYVGNIGMNKAALQSLSDSVPVTVRSASSARITRSERDCTRAIRFRLRFTRCGSP